MKYENVLMEDTSYDRQATSATQEGSDEEAPDISVIREAQAAVGELMWISGRSRPDLAYGVSLLARLIHRRPSYACSLANYMFRYINKTQNLVMEFRAGDGQQGKKLEMHAFVDASFAPPHEGYRSVQGVVLAHGPNVVMWHSMRQPFITQSTAEAELLGYGEAHQEGESFLALLQILELGVSQAVIHGDNRAALVLCNQDTGPWRTRHLRLRAAKLREVLQCPDPAWRAEYMAGSELVADGLTKPLQGQSFSKFVQRLGMTLDEEPQVRRLQKTAEAAGNDRWKSAVPLLAMLGCSLLKVNEVLGSLLVLLAGLVKLKWEGTRSNQERQESQEMTRKGGRTTIQDGENATIQDGENATLQDGENATPQDGEKATHQDGDRATHQDGGTATPQDGRRATASLGVGLGSPGIRAFRITVDIAHGGAAAADQMPMTNVQANAAVSAAASAEGASAASGTSWRASSAASGGDAAPVARASRTEGAYAVPTGGDGDHGHEPPWIGGRDYGTPSPGAQRHGGPRARAAAAGYPSRANQSEIPGGGDLGEPWSFVEYHQPRVGSRDLWRTEYWLRGWLVREHRRSRHQAFIPIHCGSNLPCDGDELQPDRWTAITYDDGSTELIHDAWTSSSQWSKREGWRGFTFFRRKEPVLHEEP